MDSTITIARDELTRKEWRKLLTALTFTDADENEVMAYQYVGRHGEMRVPRGVWDMLPGKLDVTDLRSRPPMPKLSFAKVLDEGGREGQRDAVVEMFRQQQGQVIAPPGRGKTEIGLAFAAACKTRTLVVVHTRDLFKQWEERAAASVPSASVGKIQGPHCQVEHITIAMAQTLKQYLGRGGKFWRQFGCIIVDESHHAAAETWEWVLNVCPAYYRFGLTATDKRADARHPLVRFLIGPTISRIDFKSDVPLTVVPVETGFRSRFGGAQWSSLMRNLVHDPDRNLRIADIVLKEWAQGNSVLVLSRQIKHLENIKRAIDALYATEHPGGRAEGIHLLTGTGMTQRQRDALVDAFREGHASVILATQLADEGLDVPRLNRVLLVFPGKHDGRIVQQIGRSIRKHSAKVDAIVYDFVDDFVPVLGRQFVERKMTYRKLGIPMGKVVRYGRTEKKEGRKRDRILRIARPGRA
jgi:superfamily II DNA or RNA helicase